MIALGIRAAQLAMLVVCGVLAWGVSAPLRARPIPQVDFVPLAPPERNDAAFSRYAVIGSRNLFQTPEDAPPPAPITEVIEESKLNFKVVGTISGPDNLSVAILEDAGGKRDVFGIDALIPGGAKVTRIEKGRVVLDNAGRLEALEVQDPEAPASLARLQSGQRSVARVIVNEPPPPAYVAIATPDLLERMAQLGASRPVPRTDTPPPARPSTPADRELPTENRRLARTLGTGSPAGPGAGGQRAPAFSAIAGPVALASSSPFEAFAGQPLLERLLEQVALRQGEQILAVNGIPVDAADRLPELLRSLEREGPARVRIAVDSRSEREIEVALP